MGAPQIVTLSQRIAERRSNVTPIRPSEPVQLAAWVRRMKDGQTKGKDFTGYPGGDAA